MDYPFRYGTSQATADISGPLFGEVLSCELPSQCRCEGEGFKLHSLDSRITSFGRSESAYHLYFKSKPEFKVMAAHRRQELRN